MSQAVGRPGREPTSYSTQPPASLPLGVDRRLGQKKLRIDPKGPSFQNPQPASHLFPPPCGFGGPSPSLPERKLPDVLGSISLFILTQLGTRGVSLTVAEILGGALNITELLGAPFMGDVRIKQAPLQQAWLGPPRGSGVDQGHGEVGR
jgi:hypothetical protein